MSIQTQAILSGHRRPDELLMAIATLTGCEATIRAMHRDTYKIIEIEGPTGPEALHVFLESSVAEDYQTVTGEPSILISAQSSPFARATAKQLAQAFGGFFRGTEQEDWQRIEPITPG
jgi:hypothetical protein